MARTLLKTGLSDLDSRCRESDPNPQTKGNAWLYVMHFLRGSGSYL